MKNQPRTFNSRALPRFLRAIYIAGLLPALVFLLNVQSLQAGSATWRTNPATNDWNNVNDWSPTTVPNGASDTATFAFSNTTSVSLSADTETDSIVFAATASAFTITASPTYRLRISGTGITNSSGLTQNFVAAVATDGKVGVIRFTNSAAAGSQTAFTNNGGLLGGGFGGMTQFLDSSDAGNATFTTTGGGATNANGGFTQFFDSSTARNGVFTTNGGTVGGAGSGFTQFLGCSAAGNGVFTNNGGALGAGSGATQFFGRSSAADGTFTNNGGSVSGGWGGVTQFLSRSSAANGTFTNNGGSVSGADEGSTLFSAISTADNATLIANGGLGGGVGGAIRFDDYSTGGTARVELLGNGSGDATNGNLDISAHEGRLTIGSIEGTGAVFLGSNNLKVGGNNLSTDFSGAISDRGGFTNGSGGSLTKVGIGKLVLSHRNTYTGGTTVKGGRLVVNNKGGSGTGSGPVRVNRGRLAGMGAIAGAVTVGTGSGSGAVLSPGYHHSTNPGTLTIQRPLTFNSDATYEIEVNSATAAADDVVALGVTISSGAQISYADLGSGILPAGKVFTVINNTSANPIAGTFVNLPDGSTFTSNGNTYQVNYKGGDGNDLTVTVQ